MARYDELPATPGVYRVVTRAGSVHIITRDLHRVTWERLPAPGSYEGAHDFESVVLSSMDDNWKVGGHGFLTVSEGAFIETWHRTGTIVSITSEDTS
jgi:hypothetical protein